MADALAAIARLEVALDATSKESDPYEHALIAQRLGLAYAETAAVEPHERLRRALDCFDVAARLLDPRFHPLEHARVLTAAGSARRSLGNPAAALDLFRRAVELAGGRASPDEAAAMANNVGLALLEIGEPLAAMERFDLALRSFDAVSAEGRRGRASALHNRGLARAASGRHADLVAAVADHDLALTAVNFGEAPLHHGMVQHSKGVVASTLAEIDPADAETATRWRRTAIESFTAALEVFTWPDHAVHHGIASFNLGRIWTVGATVGELRQALLSFEDAVTAFDPRHQGGPWREAYGALLATEQRLAASHPGWTRTDHLVAELGGAGEHAQLLGRRRLSRWLALPAPSRDAALVDVVTAATRVGGDVAVNALVRLLTTVMERPVEAQAGVLDALIAARVGSDDDGRSVIDRIVDRVIGEAVVGPQRVFVRDHLEAGGFERP